MNIPNSFLKRSGKDIIVRGKEEAVEKIMDVLENICI